MPGLSALRKRTPANRPTDAGFSQSVASARFSFSGAGVAAIGDSITANFGNTLTQIADSPMGYAAMLSGGRTLHRGSSATGGFTLAQILATHVPIVTGLTPKPSAVIVLGGTNDTGASSGYTLAGSLVTLTTIYDQLEAAGIRPIACTIPPRGDSSTVNGLVDKFNRAVRRLAASRGYALADYHRALTNPSTSVYRTGYGQTDGIHPSYLGTKIMGSTLSSVLNSTLPYTTAPLAETLADSTDLLTGTGLFLTDTSGVSNNIAGDGIADGWRSFGSASNTYALYSDPDGITKWQSITMPSTGGAANLQKSVVGAGAIGDQFEICARVQTTGFEAALVAPSTTGSGGTGPVWSLLLEYKNNVGSYGPLATPAYTMHCDVADGVLYARGTLPADADGTSTLRISMLTGTPLPTNPVMVRFANLAVRNLTAIGSAG